MFQLNQEEKDQVVANCDHLKNLKYSPSLPYVFTEYGVVMLASVLNSERAIAVNIQIVRIFAKMKEMLLTHKDILLKLEQLENKVTSHDENIQMIFEALKQLLSPSPAMPETKLASEQTRKISPTHSPAYTAKINGLCFSPMQVFALCGGCSHPILSLYRYCFSCEPTPRPAHADAGLITRITSIVN